MKNEYENPKIIEKANSYVGQIFCECGNKTPRLCYKKTFSDGFKLGKKTFLIHLIEQWNRHKDNDDYNESTTHYSPNSLR